MKKYLAILGLITLITGIGISYQSCSSTRIISPNTTDTLALNPQSQGNSIEFEFRKGSEHNHPVMAVWLTDTNDNYIQTIYVARSIAQGHFGHGDKSSGVWKPGAIRRPASLPVWAHSRGIQASDGLYVPEPENSVADAYTGATPAANFLIQTKTDEPLPNKVFVYFEINQSWDWNQYWNNNKYPDDEDYRASCQPALVYKATASHQNGWKTSPFELIGHSHYNGSNGSITSDVTTITTARDITESIRIEIK